HEHEVRPELLDDLAHPRLPVEVVLAGQPGRLPAEGEHPHDRRVHPTLDRWAEPLGERVADHRHAELVRARGGPQGRGDGGFLGERFAVALALVSRWWRA